MYGSIRKARLVARGALTEPPPSIIYSSVAGREGVRIGLLLAALNDIDMEMFDIGNAYLTAPTTEKLYTTLGEEFGDDKGKIALIQRALYGLRTSGAAYRSYFANVLRELGFESCLVDADVWMRPMVKDYRFKYYEYLLYYVDDCLVISHNPKKIAGVLKSEPYNYTLKDEGPPTRYLGAKVGPYLLGRQKTWYMSAELYLRNAIKEIEGKWGNLSKMFPRQSLDTPVLPSSHPEIDNSKPLTDDEIQVYQSYIGILRWAVELGRIDLAKATGTMARFSALLRENHMMTVLKIFPYCKKTNVIKDRI